MKGCGPASAWKGKTLRRQVLGLGFAKLGQGVSFDDGNW
jgi:hypothetical protein